MTVTEELLLAGERLAEAVDDIKEIHRLCRVSCRLSPPRSIEFDDGEAMRSYVEAMGSLARVLRDYRRAQQRELSAHAIRGGDRREASILVPKGGARSRHARADLGMIPNQARGRSLPLPPTTGENCK